MGVPSVFGWTAVPTRLDPRWDAVRRETIAPLKGVQTPHEVDVYVNHDILYTADSRGDRWATPRETMLTGRGDCEDIALLKRAFLIASGRQDTAILFLIVHDIISRRDHAILVVDGLVMDNFNSLTLPEAKVSGYTPMVGYTADKCWVFGRSAG